MARIVSYQLVPREKAKIPSRHLLCLVLRKAMCV